MGQPKRSVKLDKLAMAQGYLEMAQINLQESWNAYGSEEEGWRLSYEKMDSEEAGGNA